jgi:hypothetical protein
MIKDVDVSKQLTHPLIRQSMERQSLDADFHTEELVHRPRVDLQLPWLDEVGGGANLH